MSKKLSQHERQAKDILDRRAGKQLDKDTSPSLEQRPQYEAMRDQILERRGEAFEEVEITEVEPQGVDPKPTKKEIKKILDERGVTYRVKATLDELLQLLKEGDSDETE